MSAVASQPWKRNKWRRSSSTEIPRPVVQEAQQQKSLDDQIVLEHVLGMTVYSNSALTCEPRSGLVAYPAGCVLVLLDSVKNKQLGTLHTPRKSITAVSFSCDGRYVLTGESGLQPAVRVWDVTSMTEVAMLRGHSFGIKTTLFSPRMREIIVVGDAQDMMISVWSWPGKVMGSLNKFSDEIFAMDVSSNSQYFVTVGNKHVKFYYLETKRWQGGGLERACPIPLTCRYGMLDNLKENCFCDVACGQGNNDHVFVVTTSGILCQINSSRFLERWVNVNMARAFSLSTDGDHVFVGGGQGVIRMFNAYNLKIVLTLPRPHHLGLDISQVTPSGGMAAAQLTAFERVRGSRPANPSFSNELTAAATSPAAHRGSSKNGVQKSCSGSDIDEPDRSKVTDRKHPGAKALTYDPKHHNLTVVYEDHSLYIWGRQDSRRANAGFHFCKRYSSMYHRGCVWDLTTYPVTTGHQTDRPVSTLEDGEVGGALPPGALLSVSADGTLRAWDVSADICQESVLKRNLVSPQCLKIVYAEKPEPPSQKRPQVTAAATTRRYAKPQDSLPGASSARHRKQGFTVVSVCPGGVHIATGNRHGRVSIYDTNSMHVIATMHAHEAEVTALAYSITDNYKVLASGSRDRMIHVMDASRDYQLLTTLDDHSSTITAINFTYISHYLIMATSSLDMSVLVRVYMGSEAFILNPVRAIVEKKSILDFAIHPWSGSMAFACQDRYVRVYSIMTSTDHQSYRGCPSYGGQLVKVHFDPSGQYLLTACSLKTINLLQYTTGILLSTFNGHAESITSVRFSHNVKHVISSAVDGCIFLWRLPESITYAVKREMAEMGRLTRGMVFKKSWKKSNIQTIIPKRIVSEPNFSSEQESLASNLPRPTAKLGVTDTARGKRDGSGLEQHHPHHQQQQGQEQQQQQQQQQQHQQQQQQQQQQHQQQQQQLQYQQHYQKQQRQKDEDQKIDKTLQTSEVNSYLQSMKGRPLDENQSPAKPDAWLTACCERRRIFKLEARSIKKILGMMRLVTDAMEKDLANADLLVASSPCPPLTSVQKQQPTFEGVSKPVCRDSDCLNSQLPVTGRTSDNTTETARPPYSGYLGRDLDRIATLGGVSPGGLADRLRPHSPTVVTSSKEAPETETAAELAVKKGSRDCVPLGSQALYPPRESHARGDALLELHPDTQAPDLGELLKKACSRGFSSLGAGDKEPRSDMGQAVPIDHFAEEKEEGHFGKDLERIDGNETKKPALLHINNDFRRGILLPHVHKRKCFGYSCQGSSVPCFNDESPATLAAIKDLNFTASNGYCLKNVTRNAWEENWFCGAELPSTLTIVDQSLVFMSEEPAALGSTLKQQKINAWIDSSLFKSLGMRRKSSIKEIDKFLGENDQNPTDSPPILTRDDLTAEVPQQANQSDGEDDKSLDSSTVEAKMSYTSDLSGHERVRSGETDCIPAVCRRKNLPRPIRDDTTSLENVECTINTDMRVGSPNSDIRHRFVSKAGQPQAHSPIFTTGQNSLKCCKSDTAIGLGSESKSHTLRDSRSQVTIAQMCASIGHTRSEDMCFKDYSIDEAQDVYAGAKNESNNHAFRKLRRSKIETRHVFIQNDTVNSMELSDIEDEIEKAPERDTIPKEENCDNGLKVCKDTLKENSIVLQPLAHATSHFDLIDITEGCEGAHAVSGQTQSPKETNNLRTGEPVEGPGIKTSACDEVNNGDKSNGSDKVKSLTYIAAPLELDTQVNSNEQNIGFFKGIHDSFSCSRLVQNNTERYGATENLNGGVSANNCSERINMKSKPGIHESPSSPHCKLGVKYELYKPGFASRLYQSAPYKKSPQRNEELRVVVDDCIRRHIKFYTTDGDTTDNGEEDNDDNGGDDHDGDVVVDDDNDDDDDDNNDDDAEFSIRYKATDGRGDGHCNINRNVSGADNDSDAIEKRSTDKSHNEYMVCEKGIEKNINDNYCVEKCSDKHQENTVQESCIDRNIFDKDHIDTIGRMTPKVCRTRFSCDKPASET